MSKKKRPTRTLKGLVLPTSMYVSPSWHGKPKPTQELPASIAAYCDSVLRVDDIGDGHMLVTQTKTKDKPVRPFIARLVETYDEEGNLDTAQVFHVGYADEA